MLNVGPKFVKEFRPNESAACEIDEDKLSGIPAVSPNGAPVINTLDSTALIP